MRVLLVDAVEWAPVYRSEEPLRSVPSWFQRHFQSRSALDWVTWGVTQVPGESSVEGLDAVILSGSPRDAWVDDPFNDRMLDLVGDVLERQLPFLGVCYGHQILCRRLGARVGRHPAGLQLGPTVVTLSKEGRKDGLFRGIDQEFEALSGHADCVAEVPEDAVLLASSEDTSIEVVRAGETAYGVQFHPEMDAEVLQYLWRPRIGDWADRVSFDLPSRIASIRDTPQATRILTNFIDQIQ